MTIKDTHKIISLFKAAYENSTHRKIARVLGLRLRGDPEQNAIEDVLLEAEIRNIRGHTNDAVNE